MFDDDVWRYLPLGLVPSLALASVSAAAAVYVAVVRSRAAHSIAVAMLVASVMIVIAYTALVAVLSTQRPVVVGTLCALLLSTSVEVWQMLSGSFGDVDDLVLNGLGGFLGAGAATVLQSLAARAAARDLANA
jgi:glycopeptide antibiotics resistance protein